MIKRKSSVEVKEKEKFREPPRRKIKINLSELPDAVVDGKLVAPINSRVYFERTLSKVTKIHEGKIMSVSDKGVVEIFDMTVEQFYCFSLHQKLPNIKIAT